MTYTKTIAFVLALIAGFALPGQLAVAEPEQCEGGYGLDITPEIDTFVPAGTEVEFKFDNLCDGDCSSPHDWCVDTITVYNWPYTYERKPGGCYWSQSHQRIMPAGTVEEYDITFEDGHCRYDDPDPHYQFTVAWVGVGGIAGPEAVCPGGTQTYTVITSPAGQEDMLEELYSEVSVAGAGFSRNRETVVVTIPASGQFTITARIGDHTQSKTVYVGEMPPLRRVGNGGGRGDGCSNGSCGDMLMPSIWSPYFRPACPDCVSCDGRGGGHNDGYGDEEDSFTDYGCSYIGSRYIDRSGAEHPIDSEDPTDIGNGVTVTRQADQGTTGFTLTDGAGNTTQYGTPIKPFVGSSAGYSRKISTTDANGRVTSYTRDTNGALLYMDLPNGDRYTYEHSLGNTWITKSTAPDGTYTAIGYVTSGIAYGKIQSVSKYDDEDTPLSQTTYTYDGFGRVTSATTNGRQVTYAYNGDTITVTDEPDGPESKTATVYEYTAGVTTITRRADYLNASSADQTTTYYFHRLDGQNAYLWKVQDPTGAWTYYGTYIHKDAVPSQGSVEGEDYIVLDAPYDENDPDLIGKVFRVEDALGRVTESDYDSDTGALVSVTHPQVGNDPPGTETYQYYTDGSNKTRWLKTVKNVRDNYTHYVRNTGTLRHQVTAVKVDDEDHADWSGVAAIKTYDYYTSQESALQVGLLEKEIVPDIDGWEDYYKAYTYLKDLGNNEYRLEPGPTEVAYRWWNNDSQNPQYVDRHDSTEYDVMGRVLSTTDANGRTIWNTYDAQGRQLQTIYAKSGGTPTVYTASEYSCCTLTSTTDEEGRETRYAYDDAKRVTDVWTNLPNSGQSQTAPLVHYEYDSFGNVATVTTYAVYSEPMVGRATSYTYDKNNRVTRIDYPAVGQGQDALAPEEFGYDAVGNLLGKRIVSTGANKAMLYKYDNLNRLTDVYYVEDYTGSLSSPTYPSGDGNVHYTYVGGSRLRETMTDEHSIRPTRYEYDLQDRLLAYKPATPRTLGEDEESDTDVREIGYVYNNLGQKTQMKLTIDDGDPAALEVNYLYYANGWLKEVKKGTSSFAKYTYNVFGNRDRVDLGNTTYTTYAYDTADPRNSLDEIGHYGSDDELLMGYAMTYDTRDASGNPTLIKDWDDPTTGRAYSYDDNNRLASADGTDYDYDWVGNKLRYPPSSPGAMTYDATDKLVTWPNTHQYRYYPTGGLYQQKSNDGNTVQRIYSYTAANLLSQVVHGDDSQTDPKSEMEWDADSNRVTFTSSQNTGTWEFVYDPTAGVPAVVEEVHSGSVYYVRQPNGALLARTGSGGTQYYHFDALGSTRILTDYQGNKTDAYAYDAWGQLLDHTVYTGSVDQPYLFVGQLGYYSHYQDENLFDESGQQLLQLGVRFYDPEMGRFTQRDEVRQNRWSAYAYSDDAPAFAVDPSGYTCSIYEFSGVFCHQKYRMDTGEKIGEWYKRFKERTDGCKGQDIVPGEPLFSCNGPVYCDAQIYSAGKARMNCDFSDLKCHRGRIAVSPDDIPGLNNVMPQMDGTDGSEIIGSPGMRVKRSFKGQFDYEMFRTRWKDPCEPRFGGGKGLPAY